jgi:hypothetical protein
VHLSFTPNLGSISLWTLWQAKKVIWMKAVRFGFEISAASVGGNDHPYRLAPSSSPEAPLPLVYSGDCVILW